ncbi:MAG TPA: hypothetical protein VF594_00765, partial [Rubricoccaceae bacterium]
MTLSTPAVRSALVGIAAVTLVAVVAALLHLAGQQRHSRDTADTLLRADVASAATALAVQAGTPASPSRVAAAFRPYAALEDGAERVLTDAAGLVYAASDDAFGRDVDWSETVQQAADGSLVAVTVGPTRYRIAAAPVGQTGLVVAAARSDVPVPASAVRETVVWTFVLWAVLVGVLCVLAYVDGPRTADRLTAFGERIAQGESDPAAMRRVSRGLGTLAGAFAPVAARLRKEATERSELREHVAALYQVNP